VKEKSLRDEFAMAAMPLAMKRLERNYGMDCDGKWTWEEDDWDAVAMRSYDLADAMIRARNGDTERD
jgi:hypothetical protein